MKEISKHLPIAGKGAEALADRYISNSRLRRKLKAIVERGHLKKVTTEDIRQQLKILNLPEANFLDQDGHLVFDRARKRDLLDLLNEDLIIGGLSKGRFRVDRKSLDTE